MNNFWESLEKPILALAPMAGFTDCAFRQISEEFGADVVYSEMANVTALAYEPEKTLEMLKTNHKKSKYIVQLFGSNPSHYERAVKIVEDRIKPDGIDINFGCPVPKVLKVKAGSELMKDLELSYDVIKATTENTKLPVSVKTRTRVGTVSVFDFLNKIEDLSVAAIMIHGRTFTQGFSGPVDFEAIKKAKEEFDGIVLANGGINTLADAKETLEKTSADGLGLARGSLGNPWLLKEIKKGREIDKTSKEIFKTALKQAELAYKDKGERGIIEMRKHLCWYVQGLPGAKALRSQLVQVKTLKDIKKALSELK